ncbi:MAG: BufA1 family periplasmic bufferin-type metallophore [Gammaproteobacteria bacterium]
MKNSHAIVNAAVAALVALTAISPASAADKPKGEKCYGVAKAGKNDCQTAASACAGSAKQDADPTAFIYVPAGTCDKIAGGSLSPKQ